MKSSPKTFSARTTRLIAVLNSVTASIWLGLCLAKASKGQLDGAIGFAVGAIFFGGLGLLGLWQARRLGKLEIQASGTDPRTKP